MSGTNTSFSDTDSNIAFSGPWSSNQVLTNPVTGPPVNYKFANDFTAQFAFTFPKPATAFYYFGFKRSKGGLYLACVDCDPSNPQFTEVDALDVNDDGRHPPVVLFSKKFSSPGIHTVIIRNSNDTRFGASQITITSLVLTFPDNNPSSTPSSPSPAAPPTQQSQPQVPSQSAQQTGSDGSPAASTNSSQNSDVFTALGTTSNPSSPLTSATQSGSNASQTSSAPSTLTSPPPTSKSSSNAGAIAGGVVGGIAAIGAILILFWFLRRRRTGGHGSSRDALDFSPGMNQTSHRGFGQGVAAGAAIGGAAQRAGPPQMGQYPSQAAYQNEYSSQPQYHMQNAPAQQYQSHPVTTNYSGAVAGQGHASPQAYHGGGVYPVALPAGAGAAAGTAAFTYTSTASSSTPTESFSPTSEHGRTPSDSAITTSSNGRVYGTGDVKNAQLFHQMSVSTVSTGRSGAPGVSGRRAVQNQDGISPTREIPEEAAEVAPVATVPPAYDQLFTGARNVAPVH